MKIGLYFGSFNPVHNGHLIIANYFANYHDLDQIWFVVSPQNPFKESSSLLNEQHRKRMIDLAIEGEKKLRSSGIEFNLPKPSFTIDTLTYLKEKFLANNFSIIIGSDSFSNIKKWKNAEVLLRNYRFFIYKRPEFEVDPKMITENVSIVDAPLLQISSTLIRKMIKEKKSIRYLVPDIVMQEIEIHQYY